VPQVGARPASPDLTVCFAATDVHDDAFGSSPVIWTVRVAPATVCRAVGYAADRVVPVPLTVSACPVSATTAW
jgi:hypothetical protein